MKLTELYEKETGKKAESNFSPSLEYVEWLENKLKEVSKDLHSAKVVGNNELNYICDEIIKKIGLQNEN